MELVNNVLLVLILLTMVHASAFVAHLVPVTLSLDPQGAQPVRQEPFHLTEAHAKPVH